MRHGLLRGQPEGQFALAGFSGLTVLASDGVIQRHRGFLAGREVQVAVIADSPAGQAVASRLASQAETLLELDHPHLVECIAVVTTSAPVHLVTAWPGTEHLGNLCAPGVPAVDATTAIGHLLDFSRGLDAVHQAGLAHLGLRPACLHLTPDGGRIGDLGLAQVGGPGKRSAEDAVLAPEVVLGLPTDIRTDIHALGAVFYRLVFGAWPWRIETQAHLDAWARSELPPWPAGEHAPTLLAVLRRMLARAPENRYAHPGEVVEDLERISHGFSPIHARVATVTKTRLNLPPGTTTVDHLRRPMPAQVPPVPVAPPVAKSAGTSPRMLGLALGSCVVVGTVAWLALRPAGTTAPVATPAAAAPAVAAVVPGKSTAPAWASASGQDGYGSWREFTVGSVTQRLRRIPAGDAWIGSPPDETGRRDDEGRFQFTLSQDLWCADSEVTQALYAAVVGGNPSQFRGEKLPVDNVSWSEAQVFCQRLSVLVPGMKARLPTECEWEYACRAGAAGPLAVAAPADGQPRVWDLASSDKATHPVRRLQPNAWGLFDMQGNVLEWTSDAMAPYPKEPQTDRQVLHGAQRVARGGAWSSSPGDVRAASRFHFMSSAHLSFIGFRIVVE